MRRTLVAFIDTALSTGVTIIAYGIASRAIPHDVLGIFVLISSVLGLAHIAGIWGANLTSLIAEAQAAGKEEEAVGYARAAAVVGTAASGVITASLGVGLTLLLSAEESASRADYVWIVTVLGLGTWLRGLGSFAESTLLGFNAVYAKSVISCSASIVLACGCVAFVPTMALSGLLVAYVMQGVASAVVGLIAVIVIMKRSFRIVGRFSKTHVRVLVLTAIEQAKLGALLAVQEPVAKLVIAIAGGASAVFVYEICVRMVMLGRAAITFFGPFSIPTFASNGYDERSVRTFSMWHDLNKMFALLYFPTLLIIGPLIGHAWTGVDPATIATMLLPVGLGWFCHVPTVTIHFWLIARRLYNILIVGQWIRLAICVVAGCGFGMTFGPLGAAAGVGLSLFGEMLWLKKEMPRAMRTQTFVRRAALVLRQGGIVLCGGAISTAIFLGGLLEKGHGLARIGLVAGVTGVAVGVWLEVRARLVQWVSARGEEIRVEGV